MNVFLRCLFLSLSLLLGAGAGAEPPAVDPVLNKLGQTATARFHFRQTKTIAALERPLISEGEMLFSRDEGILWKIEKPRPSLFIITPSGISKREGERVTLNIRGSENRIVEGFTKVFLSLFSGDLAELEAAFIIATETGGEGWTITLTPKNSRLGEFIKGITLSGTQSVNKLELREGSGDTSRIEFSDSGSAAAEPTPAERHLFADAARAK